MAARDILSPSSAAPKNPGFENTEDGVSDVTDTVRICVLGAAGVGKSTLCNFLSDSDTFQVIEGPVQFDSCTTQTTSHAFSFQVRGQDVDFEIIDNPGWFHGEGDRVPCAQSLSLQIQECSEIAKRGITAFFIVVPCTRMTNDTQRAIHFMQTCFDSTSTMHIWMVFTKSGDATLNDILQRLSLEKSRGKKASGLIYNYAELIGRQGFAVDAIDDDEKEKVIKRETILTEMHDIYQEHGVISVEAFMVSIKDLDRVTRNNMILKASGVVMGVVVGMGILWGLSKYNGLNDEKVEAERKMEHEQRRNSMLEQELKDKRKQIKELTKKNTDALQRLRQYMPDPSPPSTDGWCPIL